MLRLSAICFVLTASQLAGTGHCACETRHLESSLETVTLKPSKKDQCFLYIRPQFENEDFIFSLMFTYIEDDKKYSYQISGQEKILLRHKIPDDKLPVWQHYQNFTGSINHCDDFINRNDLNPKNITLPASLTISQEDDKDMQFAYVFTYCPQKPSATQSTKTVPTTLATLAETSNSKENRTEETIIPTASSIMSCTASIAVSVILAILLILAGGFIGYCFVKYRYQQTSPTKKQANQNQTNGIDSAYQNVRPHGDAGNEEYTEVEALPSQNFSQNENNEKKVVNNILYQSC